MLVGELPFQAKTDTSLLKERLDPHGLDLRERISGIPSEIAMIIERCMSVQVIQRYPHASDVVDAIRAVQRSYGLADTVNCDSEKSPTHVVWSEVLSSFDQEKKQNEQEAVCADSQNERELGR